MPSGQIGCLFGSAHLFSYVVLQLYRSGAYLVVPFLSFMIFYAVGQIGCLFGSAHLFSYVVLQLYRSGTYLVVPFLSFMIFYAVWIDRMLIWQCPSLFLCCIVVVQIWCLFSSALPFFYDLLCRWIDRMLIWQCPSLFLCCIVVVQIWCLFSSALPFFYDLLCLWIDRMLIWQCPSLFLCCIVVVQIWYLFSSALPFFYDLYAVGQIGCLFGSAHLFSYVVLQLYRSGAYLVVPFLSFMIFYAVWIDRMLIWQCPSLFLCCIVVVQIWCLFSSALPFFL